ncbi:MAG: TRAP transporter substrate-binding protein [Cytophagales bacterium]|nr:TRAP transporter substrate-binding protein [Cytophagales bacterium]
MKRFVLKAALALVAVGAFTLTTAQAQERALKLSTANPKGHPITMGAEKFAELVLAKTGGKLKINVFAGGTLGSDMSVASAMQGGTIDMNIGNSGILAAQVPAFAIYDFPFMFNNTKEADAVVDGPFGKMMHKKLEDKGLVGLAYFELGFRNMTNSKRPLNKVDDIAGLKLRVIPSPINLAWVKALDANPVPMAFGEVYGALESKAIDGQENPLTVISANKFYEVQKNLALTNHVYNPQSVVMSKKTWDSLSAADKKSVSDAANEAAKYQREVTRKQAAELVDSLKKNGMAVTEFSPAELAKFADKMRPVIASFGVSVGQDVVSQLQTELSKARETSAASAKTAPTKAVKK